MHCVMKDELSGYHDQSAIDLDVVATSYRFVSDDDAFYELLTAWAKKLEGVENEDHSSSIDDQRVVKDHLERIRSILDKHGGAVQSSAIEEAVDEIDAAAMVLSPNGTVTTMNAAAATRFGATQGQRHAFNWLDPVSSTEFRAIRHAARRKGASLHTVLRTVDDQANRGLAEAFTIASSDHDQSFVAIRSLETTWSDNVDIALEKAFGLTTAEREICRALFETRDTAEIAASRGTTPNTIRTQIRAILAKTETSSQIDLIRLVGLLNARASHGKRSERMAWKDPWGNQQTFRSSNGGKIAYSWTGDRAGIPALLVHGSIQGYLLGERIESRLKEQGIRLYALTRPGFGESELSSSSDYWSVQTDAICELIEELRSGPLPVIGIGNGSIPLFRAAARRPDLFKRLLVTGLLQSFSRASLGRLTPTQRILTRMLQFAPRTSETLVRAGHRFIKSKGVDWYLERGWGDVPEAQRTLNDPEIIPLIRNACELMLAGTTWGYVQENLGQWRIDGSIYKKIECEVHHLFGETDRSVVQKDVDQWLQYSHRFSSECVPDAGYFMIYEKPDIFADRMIETILSS